LKKVPLFGCVRVFVAAAMATGDTFTHAIQTHTVKGTRRESGCRPNRDFNQIICQKKKTENRKMKR
jgi:hypothetical protein